MDNVVLPLAGIVLVILTVGYMAYMSTTKNARQEEYTAYSSPYFGDAGQNFFYTDASGNMKPVPLGAVKNKAGDGFLPVTLTTQFATSLPKSTDPSANDLVNYDSNNFKMSYHSMDLSQYLVIKDLLDKDGKIDTSKTLDMFPTIRLNPPPNIPDYEDSVIFSALNRRTMSDPSIRGSVKRPPATTDYGPYDASSFNKLYSDSTPLDAYYNNPSVRNYIVVPSPATAVTEMSAYAPILGPKSVLPGVRQGV